MAHFTSIPNDPKVLILDEELTWGEAYTGERKPRFKRWKLVPLSQLQRCQRKTAQHQ
jgi:hypothetical protein